MGEMRKSDMISDILVNDYGQEIAVQAQTRRRG